LRNRRLLVDVGLKVDRLPRRSILNVFDLIE